MKIMCIYPGATLPGFASLKVPGNNESNYINHGLSMISAVLKQQGHHVYLNDLRGFKDWQDFEEQISKQQFDITLINFMSCDELYAIKCLEIVKRHHPEKPTIAGGVHLSVTQSKSFPWADCVVLGEGEEAMIEIVNYYQEHGYAPPFYSSKPVRNLDSLPFVDRELFNNEIEQQTPLLPLLPPPFITIIFSRGCGYRCTFCHPTRQLIAGGKKRVRSVIHCMGELLVIKQTANIGSLMIHDDLFPEDTQWIGNLCELMLSTFGRVPFWNQMRSSFICKHPDLIKRLAEAGLTWISLGVESGSQRMLDFLKKGVTVEQNIEAAEIAHKNSINLFLNYILGLPTETKEDVEATARMLQKIMPAWHSTSLYTAYPGSDLYEYCVQNQLFTGDHYRRIRFPYEKKVKGIDYDYIFQKVSEFGQYKSELREWPNPAQISVPKTGHISEVFVPEEPLNPETIPIKTRRPKVSIILTSHNRPKFLKEAIDSVLKQTLSNWELIIVDSSENPEVRLIFVLHCNDKRILILRDPKGTGDTNTLSRLWNLALDYAQGRYICLLDDDNRKKPDFCEKMSQFLDKNRQYDVATCFSEMIDPEGSKLPQGRLPLGFDKEKILTQNYIDSGEMMMRAEAISKVGYFDERLETCDDWDMVIRLLYETKGIGLIEESLTEYRQHPERRMFKTLEFNAKNIKFISSKKHGQVLKLSCIQPNEENLTESQKQVCKGIMDSLVKIPFLAPTSFAPYNYHDPDAVASSDILLVLAPFQIDLEQMKIISGYKVPIVTIHMEDPQAASANIEKDRFASWIVTNDIATIPYYQKIIDPKKVLFCPSLSISQDVLKIKTRRGCKFDIVLCGYAYDSRVEFIKEFLKEPINFKLLLLGDNWKEKLKKKYRSCFIIPTRNEVNTMRIYHSAKIIICLHRNNKDIGGFPIMSPQSIHRGYIEAYSGALVMIDDKREQHSFGSDEVVFFSSPKDLREKIYYYLAHPKEAKAMAKKAQMRAARDFTFKARLTKILNCVRSERYNMVIP